MESEIIKLHDGVEVIKGEYGWACYKSGKAALGGKDTPTPTKIYYSKVDDDKFLFFSSEPACQAYIDSMNEPKPPVISVSMYNQAGEKIISSEVCEFETGVHDGGLKNDMHQPIFEFTNETGKPITIKEGQRIAWKDGRVKLFGDATSDLHYALIQFSHAYNIPINTVLEFIVNQKSTAQ